MKVTNLTIEFYEFDHQAMVDNRSDEVAEILREIANQINEYGVVNADGMILRDSNGNRVSEVSVEWEEDDEEECEE